MTALQIQYFLKVADCMSFSQAASELFVAQPSVSRQIQQLEKELGYTLFDRTQRRAVSLTEAGMVFRDCFRRAQSEFRQAQSAAQSLRENMPLRLRVGVGEDWDLSRTLHRFRDQVYRHYPQAGLEFYNLPFLQLHSRLASGELDAIFCTGTSLQTFDDLEVQEIARLKSRAYVRRGLLRPEGEELHMEDYADREVLMLPEAEAPMALQIIQLQFYAHKTQIRPRLLPNRASIHQALLMGDGFAVFDELMWMGTDPRLTWCLLPDDIPLSLIWHKRDHNPLIHLLSETAAEDLGRNARGQDQAR